MFLSIGHTSFDANPPFLTVEEMVRSLGGMAAERAFQFYSSGGSADMADLEEELRARDCYTDAMRYVPAVYDVVTYHYSNHIECLRELALELEQKDAIIVSTQDWRDQMILDAAAKIGGKVYTVAVEKLRKQNM